MFINQCKKCHKKEAEKNGVFPIVPDKACSRKKANKQLLSVFLCISYIY